MLISDKTNRSGGSDEKSRTAFELTLILAPFWDVHDKRAPELYNDRSEYVRDRVQLINLAGVPLTT